MTAECNHLIFLSEIKSALRYNVPLDVIRSRREAHSRRRLVMKAVGGEGDTSHPPWLQILEDASRRLRVVLIWWGDSWEEIACTIDFYLLGCWNVAQPRQGSWFPAFKLCIVSVFSCFSAQAAERPLSTWAFLRHTHTKAERRWTNRTWRHTIISCLLVPIQTVCSQVSGDTESKPLSRISTRARAFPSASAFQTIQQRSRWLLFDKHAEWLNIWESQQLIIGGVY